MGFYKGIIEGRFALILSYLVKDSLRKSKTKSSHIKIGSIF